MNSISLIEVKNNKNENETYMQYDLSLSLNSKIYITELLD